MEENQGTRHRLEGQDPLLHPFLSADDDEQARMTLGTLLNEQAIPIIHAVLGQRLGVAFPQGSQAYTDLRHLDAQDLSQQTLAALIARLWRLHVAPDTNRIAEFRAYVAGTTFNVWRGAVRSDSPLWSRLSRRLAYLFRGSAAQTGFAKWEDAEHGALAGFEVWRQRKAWAVRFDLSELETVRDSVQPNMPLPEVAALVLRTVGGPLPWNDFVTALASVLQVKIERVPLNLETIDELARETGPKQPGAPDTESLSKERLMRVWNGICRLDYKERAVLLLKAEDLLDFELTKIATLEIIAKLLHLSEAELAKLLPMLPLDDSEIGRLLRIRRQSVVNLRSQARSLLRRFLRTHAEAVP
jgi:DNA-directed RNA polymerase specialized sigma24 family protein